MYKNLNDYEILYLISDNNDDYYGIMLNKYEPLIRKIIVKYKYVVKKMGYDDEDLYQLCALTLYKATKKYNSNENSNMFYTYLLRSLENTILSVIKDNDTNKKKVLNDSFSYDNYLDGTTLTYADILPDNKAIIEDNLYDNYAFYLDFKNLFEFDIACVLELKIMGYNNREISSLLELSYSEVIRAIKKIRQKISY